MFSGLSKLLDKAFVLGFFLPAVIAIFGFAFANKDVEFFSDWLKAVVSGNKELGNLATFLGAVWIFAVFLMALNHTTYRLLEGYLWPFNRQRARNKQQKIRLAQRKLIRQYDTAYEVAKKKKQDASSAVRSPTATEEEKNQLAAADREESESYQTFLREKETSVLRYPAARDDVLPTRFGNVLRSMEMYPTDMYSAEIIHVWPRLLAVIPHEYQSLMAEARSTVDFLVSLVVLASVTSLFSLFRIVGVLVSARCWTPQSASSGRAAIAEAVTKFWATEHAALLSHTSAAVIAAGVAWCCYEMAISAAGRWGAYVKGAFDLYLSALANALGYKLPQTLAEQKDFWDAWSSQFRFHDRVDATGWVAVSTAGKEEGRHREGEGEASERGDAEGESGDGDDSDSSE
jgi:hypothetical protein